MHLDLQYPIGKWERTKNATDAQRGAFIDTIAAAPASLAAAVAGLTPAQLDTTYRPGGWTIRQVVHHVPDSHMNAYVRFKLALTEDVPTIKPYDEARWAELPDVKSTPIQTSLALLENLHQRWVILLRALTPQDWARQFKHPDLGPLTLDTTVQLYAWHGRHHVAHITGLRSRSGW